MPNPEFVWRETLYRQLAHQPGLPAGLRPEMIKRAERLVARPQMSPSFAAPHGPIKGCKGAVSR